MIVATEDGKVYFKTKFEKFEKENMQTGIQETSMAKLFGTGALLQIGGSYRNRFALLRD